MTTDSNKRQFPKRPLWNKVMHFHVRFCFNPIYFVGGSCFIYLLFVILLSNMISTPYDVHVVYSNTTGVTSGARTAYRSGTPGWGSCCSFFSFSVVFCRSLFGILSFFSFQCSLHLITLSTTGLILKCVYDNEERLLLFKTILKNK